MRILLVSLLFAAAACNKEVATEPPAPEAQVNVDERDFTPSLVRIIPGGKVRFAFGGVPHNVVFKEVSGRPDNIERLLSNTVEERVFSTEGIFPFECRDHPSMTGTVHVERPAVAS